MKRIIIQIIVIIFLFPIDILAANETIFFDSLTGHEFHLPEMPLKNQNTHRFYKYGTGNVETKQLIQIYSMKSNENYTRKASKQFFKERNFGTEYKTEEIKLKHQKGYKVFFNYYDTVFNSNTTICVSVLPSKKSITYLVEQSPQEDNLFTNQILSSSVFNHGIFSNHFQHTWVFWIFIIDFCIMVFCIVVFHEEISLPKYNVFSKKMSLLITLTSFALIALVFNFNFGTIGWSIVVGLLFAASVFALSWPNEKVRGNISMFLLNIFKNMG